MIPRILYTRKRLPPPQAKVLVGITRTARRFRPSRGASSAHSSRRAPLVSVRARPRRSLCLFPCEAGNCRGHRRLLPGSFWRGSGGDRWRRRRQRWWGWGVRSWRRERLWGNILFCNCEGVATCVHGFLCRCLFPWLGLVLTVLVLAMAGAVRASVECQGE